MAEEGQQVAGAVRMTEINAMVENIRVKAQLIARANKYDSGIIASGIPGFAAGFVIALLIILVPVLFL
ncbi:MAG: tetrahydromethanopterin S-methyltransferase subunit F [Methanomicrobiales archaeon]|jgi:tetrahydromethanopterin S-methyltransferase subunit F|nr:tetrahydromethanopterin S-methyltransferase subunit F [Methanomicrobiales archaeon]